MDLIRQIAPGRAVNDSSRRPAVPSLRHQLREATRAEHETLENLPAMRAYAAGAAGDGAPKWVIATLTRFWHGSAPASATLPPRYHRVLRAYRAALRRDSGASNAAPGRSYDEVAYFYLLLGSSHGARLMLATADRSTDASHLRILSDRALPLWRPFVHEVLDGLDPARHAAVVRSARNMFSALHREIDKGRR